MSRRTASQAASAEAGRRADTRITAARAGGIGAVVALVGLLVFAVQNTDGALVHFLWLTWSPPVFAVILAAFLVGILAGTALGSLRHRGRRPSGSSPQ